jgi:hypothetical protein
MGSGHEQGAGIGVWFKRVVPVPATSHRLLLLACLGIYIGMPTQAFGQNTAVTSPNSAVTATLSVVASSPEATLLRQIQQAARHLNYEGVFTFQQGEAIESSRMVHAFDGKDEKERIEETVSSMEGK